MECRHCGEKLVYRRGGLRCPNMCGERELKSNEKKYGKRPKNLKRLGQGRYGK